MHYEARSWSSNGIRRLHQASCRSTSTPPHAPRMSATLLFLCFRILGRSGTVSVVLATNSAPQQILHGATQRPIIQETCSPRYLRSLRLMTKSIDERANLAMQSVSLMQLTDDVAEWRPCNMSAFLGSEQALNCVSGPLKHGKLGFSKRTNVSGGRSRGDSDPVLTYVQGVESRRLYPSRCCIETNFGTCRRRRPHRIHSAAKCRK